MIGYRGVNIRQSSDFSIHDSTSIRCRVIRAIRAIHANSAAGLSITSLH